MRILFKQIMQRIAAIDAESPDEAFAQWVRSLVEQSRIDRVVLLALDGAHDADGNENRDRTHLIAGNNFVAKLAGSSPRILFGASIHPYRRDALQELDRAAQGGACLIKWLPSAQNINPSDPRCIPFYERLAHYKLPLLCHTGIEHTLAQFSNRLNDPNLLISAVRHGVTVIAAHCGTRMFLYERSFFSDWARMALEYPDFYGDLSAFVLPLHGMPLQRILKDRDLTAKVLYGSDFPIPPMIRWYLPQLGWRKTAELNRIDNLFDRTYMTMRALGVPDEVFSRAGSLLRLARNASAGSERPA